MRVTPIQVDLDVKQPRDRAFDHFVRNFGAWWPRDYSWAQDKLARLIMGDAPGALCSEIGPHGFRVDWGRVITFEPPKLIGFLWQISPDRQPVPDPDQASKIRVDFDARANGCHITLTHDDFDNHGANAEGYRAALAADQGWPHLLKLYRESLEGSA